MLIYSTLAGTRRRCMVVLANHVVSQYAVTNFVTLHLHQLELNYTVLSLARSAYMLSLSWMCHIQNVTSKLSVMLWLLHDTVMIFCLHGRNLLKKCVHAMAWTPTDTGTDIHAGTTNLTQYQRHWKRLNNWRATLVHPLPLYNSLPPLCPLNPIPPHPSLCLYLIITELSLSHVFWINYALEIQKEKTYGSLTTNDTSSTHID